MVRIVNSHGDIPRTQLRIIGVAHDDAVFESGLYGVEEGLDGSRPVVIDVAAADSFVVFVGICGVEV